MPRLPWYRGNKQQVEMARLTLAAETDRLCDGCRYPRRPGSQLLGRIGASDSLIKRSRGNSWEAKLHDVDGE